MEDTSKFSSDPVLSSVISAPCLLDELATFEQEGFRPWSPTASGCDSGNTPSYKSDSDVSMLSVSLSDEMNKKDPDDLWLNDCLGGNFDSLIDEQKDKDLFDYLTNQAESVNQENNEEDDVDVEIEPNNNEEPDLTKLYSQLAPEKKSIQNTARTIRIVRVTPAQTLKPPSIAESDDNLNDKNRKNAIQARLNRQKKKQYIQGLEKKVDELTSENGKLVKNSANLQKDRDSLEEEVAYLKSVLANQSTLSSLLQNISNVDNVELSSSFSLNRKRSTEQDHDYVKPPKKSKTNNSKANDVAGLCLHVDKNKVSLEFCSKCSQMSKGGRAKKR